MATVLDPLLGYLQRSWVQSAAEVPDAADDSDVDHVGMYL